MAYQLLCGHLPFDDRKNPFNPSISTIWKAILMDKVSFDKSYWKDISAEAIEFVKLLLDR